MENKIEAKIVTKNTIEFMQVFIAEPIVERLIVDRSEEDTDDDLARRQYIVDAITGWDATK